MSTKRQFLMGSTIWHEVYENTKCVIMEDTLNQYVDLHNYGSGVKHIYFTHIIVLPTSELHPNFQRYRPRKKEVHFGINLGYEEVKSRTNDEVLQLMGQSFLDSILRYPELKIKDFDHQRFYKEVQKLFAAKGWLKTTQQAA